jgi:probable F420-dependent oxidoreductase
MRIGLMIFPTETTIQPVELAVAAEERGFESVWFPEHSHIPTSRETPWGGRDEAPPLPDHYWRSYDQIVALAAVATATTTLRLGTGISLVAQHDPLWLAKQIATLDVLSDGRVEFGIGYGWNREEMRSHGVAYGERRAMLREHVLTMRALWTEEEASFSGDFVHLEPSWAWPKPVQQPHPPIVMGGAAGPKTIAHIVEFCDGWMPIYGRYAITDAIGRLREAAEDAGRDPATIEIGVFSAPGKPDRLEALRDAGVSRIVLFLPQESRDAAMKAIESHTQLVEQFADQQCGSPGRRGK